MRATDPRHQVLLGIGVGAWRRGRGSGWAWPVPQVAVPVSWAAVGGARGSGGTRLASLGHPLWPQRGLPQGESGPHTVAGSAGVPRSPRPRPAVAIQAVCGQPRGLPGARPRPPVLLAGVLQTGKWGARARPHRGRAVRGQAGTPAPPLGRGRGPGQASRPQRGSPPTRPGPEPRPPRRPWLRPLATPASPTGTRGGAWTAGCADWTRFRTHAALIGRALPAHRRPPEEPRRSQRPETRLEAAAVAAAPGPGRGGFLQPQVEPGAGTGLPDSGAAWRGAVTPGRSPAAAGGRAAGRPASRRLRRSRCGNGWGGAAAGLRGRLRPGGQGGPRAGRAAGRGRGRGWGGAAGASGGPRAVGRVVRPRRPGGRRRCGGSRPRPRRPRLAGAAGGAGLAALAPAAAAGSPLAERGAGPACRTAAFVPERRRAGLLIKWMRVPDSAARPSPRVLSSEEGGRCFSLVLVPGPG